MDAEVIIAGAGPAGCGVAARLAQRGLAGRVLMLERYRFPREKPCGGALTGHIEGAMAALDLELRVPVVDSSRARVRYFDREREVAMGKPVRMIRRRDYDADLAAQVAKRGVEISERTGIAGYRREGDAIAVDLKGGGALRCRVLVGADGAASVVRKQLVGGRAVPHRLFMAELPAPDGLAGDTRMLYDFTPMARGLRGYQWVFPSPEGRINVGLMHYPAYRRGGKDLVALLRRELVAAGVELDGARVRGWPVWGYHPRTPVSEPGVLLVGDAAGIDGLTGEGIAVALEQGAIAGDRIARGLQSGELGFAGYRRELRRAVVGRELALDRHLARMLYDRGKNDERWRRWLSLVLLDDDVIEMYARRVDGTEVLADQKARLFAALVRHLWRRRRL
jgi:geranylgeranyl reductase family protein